ncbi:hypothetical protein LWI29_000993 [Acer saccharum]|uniref:Nuclear speckle splicing regulatory protein 1 N-terminal domain-containing protein n=1 Tax=Acer saccharum TaxID=4024 RepID=A0AA39TB09_ACESA|nr:hypothetical protein LWI29_000993 [Acer saccharum]
MKNYGLQLRVPPSQQKKKPAKPPLPPPLGFRDDDDDDVEREISRQASKNKALRETEEQHKKALEEDPSVFDYDGVYDEMKEKTVRHKLLVREDQQPKYIHKLIKKAEERQRDHDIIYERKLAKERNNEEHLYADKDKFVTSAYRKKLEEREKWEAQQRLRDLRDEKEDVTKKKDLSDFYFNLGKNIAFGGNESKKLNKQAETRKPEKQEEQRAADPPTKDHLSTNLDSPSETPRVKEGHKTETSMATRSFESSDSKPASDNRAGSDSLVEEESVAGQPSEDQPKRDHHKRSEDAITAAKERFLARKRAKGQ